MEAREFGERLRQLREEAGLSQTQLADKAGVNFTYLSKIESGAKPPPSEKVILRLAEVLDANSDELMTLAGKVPSDIVEMLKSREKLQSLRSGRVLKNVRSADRKESFNTRLRELRQQAHLSQRQLADKVGVDATYISKIENEVLAPPSKSTILKLAEVLNADKDELLILAGRVPLDVTEMLLKNREMLQLIRSTGAQKTFKASNNVRTSLLNLTRRLRNSTKGAGLFFKNNRGFSRGAIAVIITLAIVTSLLWVAPAAKAVELTLPNFPTNMYTNQLYSFYAQVDINDNELIPIINLRLDITGPTPAFVVFNVDGTITSQSGHFVSITPVQLPYYAYGYGYGYGYGYQPHASTPGYGYGSQPPGSYGYFGHWWGKGYGYGYGYGAGLSTQAIYLVVLNTTGMSTGSYQAQLACNVPPVPKAFLSRNYPFTLTTAPVVPVVPVVPYGVGVPAPTVVTAVGSIDLTPYLDAEGRTTVEIRLTSPDGLVTIVIPRGTKMLDAEGNPLGSIEIIVLSTPPPPPGYALVGRAYDFRPDGATFEPGISVTFSYDPADIPTGVGEEDLVLAYWDGNEWVMLPTTVDTVANTVTADVLHFTPFGILAKLPLAPAAFAVSALTVSPIEVDIGETVTISVLVTNTGELTGSYEVTLKINNVAVATKDVTLAGGVSEKVSFTTTKDIAGTYTVDVNGLVDKFVVRAPVPVPPAPAAFEVSQLSISPTEVQVGETVTVSATVANTGEVEDSYTVTLKINGVTEATKKVTLAGGRTTKVTFPVVRDVAGSYQVDIDGQTGSFTVTEVPLAWWIWLIVGLVVVVIGGLLAYLLWWRRRIA